MGSWESFPRLKLQALNAFEFRVIRGDKRGAEAPRLSGNEEVEWADGFPRSFQSGTNVGVMECGIQGKLGDPEQA